MNGDTGIYGQRLTLMEQLRAATSLHHARLQTAPFFQALAGCRLPLESYVGLLRAMLAIHGVLERALATCEHPAVTAVWRDDMRKVPFLERDLRFFEPRAVADLEEAVNEALRVTDRVRLWSVERPWALLGCCYVLEGSTLGTTILEPQCRRAFLLKDEDGLAYLHSYGSAVRERWEAFGARMNVLDPTPEDRDPLLEAAREFFENIENVYRALYPFAPESQKYLVTSINPEAGRHPVPSDPKEVAAAVKAGDRCWEAFPYYKHRYGERGRRFARSDAGWLATLGSCTPEQIRGQVRWLGGLLAARGMPTLLLETQLEMLREELTSAVPEKRFDFERLSAAAAELRAAREKHLGEAFLRQLDEMFDREAGSGAKIRSVGTLLGAAVADEREGFEGAVESLRTWLADRERFSERWVAAVDTTLTEARRLATL